MEVMEEGNLMDRVPILLDRDRDYYEKHQTILQETICPGVVGGKLDFPRYASFASVKLVNWWEDEYYAAYKKNSGLLHLDDYANDNDIYKIKSAEKPQKIIVKDSDPEKFVLLTSKSADKLLEHLHTLSQEALDHADLTVLTATIGACALIKNALWVYLQSVTEAVYVPRGDEPGCSLKISYRQFSEMTEALAERLLDLHNRLLMLYIIQDADCLFWDCKQPFFESERGSFTIQMWWLYLQGTRQDLWNSVPPSMAQRVLAGMLNDTLSILTVRYAQTRPSQARTQLLLTDICNLLLCAAEILPCVCDSGEAYAGLNLVNQSTVIRDVHAKCHELFVCLLLRGVSLGQLYKHVRKNSGNLQFFNTRECLPAPWMMFASPKLFGETDAQTIAEIPTHSALTLELRVLLSAPQANWSLLVKVLLMRNAKLSSIIMHHLLEQIPKSDCFVLALAQPFMAKEIEKCDGFLCGKECNNLWEWVHGSEDKIGQTNYQIVLALTYVVVMSGKRADIEKILIGALEKSTSKEWSQSLDRRQVWNQKRPPWLEALNHFVYPVLDPVIEMLLSAVKDRASMYQAMSLAIHCLSEMWDCIPEVLYSVASSLGDIVGADVRPLGDSVLIQILFSALYTKLLEWSEMKSLNVSTECLSLAEAICSMDEDDKHTTEIKQFLDKVKSSRKNVKNLLFADPLSGSSSEVPEDGDSDATSATFLLGNDDEEDDSSDTESPFDMDVESADFVPELLSSDVLKTAVGKKSMKLLYTYLRNNTEWVYQQLCMSRVEVNAFQALPGQALKETPRPLLNLMFYIGVNQPFDQLLTSAMSIDYSTWLQTPMSMSKERAWLQVSQRYEFQENAKLSLHETAMIASITSHLKPKN